MRDPNLLCEPEEKAGLENRNADDQLDYITWLVDRGAVDIRESHVRELQKLAVQGIYQCAGNYRTFRQKVYISSGNHTLPEAAGVPTLVQDAVDWLNRERKKRSALECAAYALWRFNWIHPFAGGNGRTARAIAYLIVCAGAGKMFPGEPVMPNIIYERRDEYIRILRLVDASAEQTPDNPDFGPMAVFLGEILTSQLAAAIARVSNKPKTDPPPQ